MAGKLAAWVQASRPLAQGNIAPALLLGQALAYSERGTFSIGALLLAQLFGVLDQLFILFVNDYADTETDALNQSPTPYSGGSRVVPEGKLTREALGRGALWVLVLLVAMTIAASAALQVWSLCALTLAGVVLVWAYSLPPLRLAYRGHGELLQALGVGVVLPLFGYAIQRGGLEGLPWALPVAGALLGYAGNLTTCLPDQASDALSDKRSFAVRFGQRRARIASLVWLAMGCTFMAMGLPGLSGVERAVCLVVVLASLLPNVGRVRGANRETGPETTRFVLHNGAAIALSFFGPAVALVV